jgi:uncharacterized protein
MTLTDAQLTAQAQRLNISVEALRTYLDAGYGKRAPGVVRAVHITAKPAGSACNLDCDYCYYLSKEGLLRQANQRIREDLLERFITEYIATQDTEEIAFTWHGGEPTLLGLDFFRSVVRLQARHLPAGRRISNDLQTNGTLLDDDWCRFLAEHQFLVGLSLDGPREVHERHRPSKSGASTFDAVVAAAQRLRRHGVTFSTLTVVNRDSPEHALSIYRFLRDEIGSVYMQFIPCVEPQDFRHTDTMHLPEAAWVAADSPRVAPQHPLSIVTPWSVSPQGWGEFLCAVWREWRGHDRGRVRINLFENLFALQAGQPAHICTHAPVCGKNLALEHDGRVYSCDHFVYPAHEIGRIGEQPLAEMAFSLKQLEFGLAKFNRLPTQCKRCEYLKLCWGECPRTRILQSATGDGALSYLCEGWKQFYRLAVGARKQGKPASTEARPQ